MLNNKTVNIPPRLDSVRAVCEEMADIVTSDNPQDQDLHYRVNLALTESITNSIEHGLSAGKSDIKIIYHKEDDLHIFQITDPGKGIEMSKLSKPKLSDDPLADSHRGLVIVNWAADEINGKLSEDGFTLTLIFRSRLS